MIKEIGDENTILPRKVHAALSTALTLANNMTGDFYLFILRDFFRQFSLSYVQLPTSDPTASTLTMMMCEAFVQMFVRLVAHFENHIVQTSSGELQFEVGQ